DAVHGGMRGAEVHEHVLAALAAGGRPLAQEQLSGRPFVHGHISILLASPSAAARASLRSAPISIIARLAFGCGSLASLRSAPISIIARLAFRCCSLKQNAPEGAVAAEP